MKYYGRGLKKQNKILEKLTNDFEEDPVAEELNMVNEKQLNKTMRRIIKNTKTIKPINTKILVKNL